MFILNTVRSLYKQLDKETEKLVAKTRDLRGLIQVYFMLP